MPYYVAEGIMSSHRYYELLYLWSSSAIYGMLHEGACNNPNDVKLANGYSRIASRPALPYLKERLVKFQCSTRPAESAFIAS